MTTTARLVSSFLGMVTATATIGYPITVAAVARFQADSVLLDVPMAKQPYMLCLAASVSMVLAYCGTNVSTETIAGAVPVYEDGTVGRNVRDASGNSRPGTNSKPWPRSRTSQTAGVVASPSPTTIASTPVLPAIASGYVDAACPPTSTVIPGFTDLIPAANVTVASASSTWTHESPTTSGAWSLMRRGTPRRSKRRSATNTASEVPTGTGEGPDG